MGLVVLGFREKIGVLCVFLLVFECYVIVVYEMWESIMRFVVEFGFFCLFFVI